MKLRSQVMLLAAIALLCPWSQSASKVSMRDVVKPAAPITLNLSPQKQQYCRDEAILIDLDLINRSAEPVLVDVRELWGTGVLQKIAVGTEIHGEFTWYSGGDISPNEEFFHSLQPGEHAVETFDLRSPHPDPLESGQYILQVRYRSFSKKVRDGIRTFIGIVESDRVIIEIVDCEVE